MTTFLLVCVFGITPHTAGITKSHSLTPLELSRYLAFERSIDDSCEDCDAAYLEQRHALERSMCRASYGANPDLSWVEARAEIKAVRS